MKLSVLIGNEWKDITDIVNSVSYEDSLDNISTTLSFVIVHSPTQRYMPCVEIEAGTKVQYELEGSIVFRGMCISYSKTGESLTASCTDFSFYLDKSEIITQFIKSRVTEAIKTLCASAGITINKLCSMDVVITEVFSGTYATIIEELVRRQYQKDGKNRNIYMTSDGLVVEQLGEQETELLYKPADDVNVLDIIKNLGKPEYSESMADRKTAVLAIVKDNEAITKTYSAKNKEDLGNYGQITALLDVSKADCGNIENIAKQELEIKNRNDKSISVQAIGSVEAKSGRVINLQKAFKEIGWELSGKYRIESVVHNITKSIHTMQLTLRPIANEVTKRGYEEYKTEDKSAEDTTSTSYLNSSYVVGVQGGDVNKNFKAVYARGKEELGEPYIWGGGHVENPTSKIYGWDCSGIVSYMIRAAIPNFPVSTAQGLYSNHTQKIKYSELLPGDLIFYGKSANNITHVTMWIGNNKMIEAGCSGGVQVAKYRDAYAFGRVTG